LPSLLDGHEAPEPCDLLSVARDKPEDAPPGPKATGRGACSSTRAWARTGREYIARIDDGVYDQMIYVFHSGEAVTDDDRVRVIGPEKLADLVIDAGLMNWLIRKVS